MAKCDTEPDTPENIQTQKIQVHQHITDWHKHENTYIHNMYTMERTNTDTQIWQHINSKPQKQTHRQTQTHTHATKL